MNLGQNQRGIEDCNEAIRLKPDLVMAYISRGIAYTNLGQYQRAIENYSEAIRLKPDDVIALSLRGHHYILQGENSSGCRDLQKLCELGKCDKLENAKRRGYCY